MKGQREFISDFSNLNTTIQVLKGTVIILLIVVVLLSLSLIVIIGKQQVFIKVDDGKAIPAEILDGNALNLISYTQFLTDFLERAYCWTPATFHSQIQSALPLMTEEARLYFEKELAKNRTYDIISKNRITNILIVKYIDIDSVVPTEDGWLINVDALKLRIIEVENTQGVFSSKPVPVRFTIGFKTCPLSRENIWGFKVYYLEEQEILG